MNRRSRLINNSLSSVIYQIIVVICGFILPRAILKGYGSDVNGLVSSITQYLGFISLLDMGVGAVVQSALYKPLAENDHDRISELFLASRKFFRIIAAIVIAYVAILVVIYPRFINDEFGTRYTAFLILIIAISQVAQYLISIPYQLLLNADQKIYVQCNINSVSTILNTVCGVALIYLGCSIHMVKLASSVIFLMRPIALKSYVSKHYEIDYKEKASLNSIDQKWSGLSQHIATTVMNNTDVMILSAFSTLSSVSIYTVYNLVVTGIKQLANAISGAFNPLLGNMYAKDEKQLLNKTFDEYEIILNYMFVIIYTVALFLIVPFALVYTRGINDADYNQHLFAVIMILGQLVYCIRLPYNSLITAAGHYRQTQVSAIIEMSLNVVMSIILVGRYGLVGVAIGTLIAIVYRTLYFVFYIHHNIIHRSYKKFVLNILADLLSLSISILVCNKLSPFLVIKYYSYSALILSALKYTLIVFLIATLVFAFIHHKKFARIIIGRLKKVVKK